MDVGIGEKREFLRQVFRKEAHVLDVRRGYISVSPFNLRMRPDVLKAAAYLIACHYRQSHIDVVHGIPHGGNYLATAVALEIGNSVRLHASRKDQNIPVSWKEVYRQEVRSFTTSGEGATVFSGINLSFVRPGERVLLIDDVCATGETGERIISGLLGRGVTVVGFAVLFDKTFQQGLDRITQLGIDVYSCVSIKEITSDGEIRVA